MVCIDGQTDALKLICVMRPHQRRVSVRLAPTVGQVKEIPYQAEYAKVRVEIPEDFRIVRIRYSPLRIDGRRLVRRNERHRSAGLKLIVCHGRQNWSSLRKPAAYPLVPREARFVVIGPPRAHLEWIVQVERAGDKDSIPLQDCRCARCAAKFKQDLSHCYILSNRVHFASTPNMGKVDPQCCKRGRSLKNGTRRLQEPPRNAIVRNALFGSSTPAFASLKFKGFKV